MKFTQKYFALMLQTYMQDAKPTVIFATDDEKPLIERQLLKTKKAFFHIQVTTPSFYLKQLLAKTQMFDVHLLSQAEGLVAVKRTLEMSGLHYFKGLTIDGNLLTSLLHTFEKMADIDLNLDVPFDELSSLKWQELKMMYAFFCNIKGKALFESELLQSLVSYLDPKTRYVDFTHRPYSRSWSMFLKAGNTISLDNQCLEPETEMASFLDKNYHQPKVEANPCLPLDIYQVQFVHQEYLLIIEEISKALKQKTRYQDIAVYFPNTELLYDFVAYCPYPCTYECVETQEKDLAFLNSWLDYLYTENQDSLDKARKLTPLNEEDFALWQAKWQEAKPDQYLSLLKEVVADVLLVACEDLPLDLDLKAFALIVPLLLSTNPYVANDGIDRIQLLTYHRPILAKRFEYVFLCGLNEDVYPTKVSDGGLLLNSELRHFYQGRTPLDRQNEFEWDLVKHIFLTAKHFVASCHFDSLDGTECLSSLLLMHLLQLKGLRRCPIYPLPNLVINEEDKILADFETSLAQPQPLSSDFAKQLYAKHGHQQVSPSELENFNQCPFRHFVSYGLRLYPSKSAMATRQRFGNLMHDLLDNCSSLFGLDFMERLMKREKDLGLSSQGSLDERLAKLMQALLKEKAFVPETAEEKYLYEAFQIQFLNTLKILLHHLAQGEFTLAYHEHPIHATKDEITYTGRIDRADVYKNYLKILDYKSSQKKLELGLAMQGFNIQMLVYLELLSQKYNLDKGAVLYFNTGNRKLTSKGRMNLDATSAEDFIAEYKMEGYVLEEEKHDVMHAIDCNYTQSQIANIRYVKSKDAYSGNLLTSSQWDCLLKEIFQYLHGLVDRCFEQGEIAIYPAGSKDSALDMKVSPCQYCDYQNICLKDPFYHDQREVSVYSKEEIDNLLKGESGDESSEFIK